MKTPPAIFLLCALLAMSGLGQNGEAATGLQDGDPEIEELVELTPKYQALKDEQTAKARAALAAGDFDTLEAMAAELRQTHPVFNNGAFQIENFYRALPPEFKAPDKTWQSAAAPFEAWLKAKPDSVAARIAFAQYWANYAWKARGIMRENEVTEEGHRLLLERSAKARKLLEEARKLPVNDPYLPIVSMYVSLGEGTPATERRPELEQAHRDFPGFWLADVMYAYTLSPAWGNGKGDWEKFAAQAAARSGNNGPATYARILIRLQPFYRNIFEETDANWDQTKAGLQQLLKRYPDSEELISQAALLASLAEDQHFAKHMFEKLDRVRYLEPVFKDKESYVLYRNWARGAKLSPEELSARQAAYQQEADRLKINPGTVWNEGGGIKSAALKALEAKDYDALEKQASGFRTTDQLYSNGDWKILTFYGAFTYGDKVATDLWKARLDQLRDWIAARPDNVTPYIAYARTLVDYAWRARGDGYIHTVTPEGFRLMQSRLREAKQALMNARKLQDIDPVWWSTAITVAMGQQVMPKEFDALITEAHAEVPDYWPADTRLAYALLPRWHGRPGQWEKTAVESATFIGADRYARIILSQQQFYNNIFRESRADWPLTKAGLLELMKKYPDSVELQSQTARLAILAKDWKLANDMFDKIGDEVVPFIWQGKASFIDQRKKARAQIP